MSVDRNEKKAESQKKAASQVSGNLKSMEEMTPESMVWHNRPTNSKKLMDRPLKFGSSGNACTKQLYFEMGNICFLPDDPSYLFNYVEHPG